MRGNKNFISNIIKVLISNVSTIVAGIIIGFIIPKVISVEGFGYYKTFTLYASYAGLFSLGIIDGIVLDYGGCDYEDYDKELFRSIFRWYVLIHLVWAALLIAVSFFFKDSNYSYIVIMIAVYMMLSNFVGFFQQISQITQRFKEYSLIKITQSAMRVASGLIMVAIFLISKNLVSYKIYVCLSVLEFLFVSAGYFHIYKEIIKGRCHSLASTRKTVIHLSTIGFPLLFANLSSTLILNIDRQFVNILFSNTEYAVYAFAYNLLALVTVATSAVATVLYPMLKRTTKDTLKKNYSNLIGTMLMLVFGIIIIYFPLCWFITWFLPNYTESLIIFRIIFPGLAISSAITVIMHNYYKTLGDNMLFFVRSLIVLGISAAANYAAYSMFHTTVSISMASIISILIWYVYAEQYFVKNYQYSRWGNLLYIFLMMGAFYMITIIDNLLLSGLLYAAAFIIITVVLQKPLKTMLK